MQEIQKYKIRKCSDVEIDYVFYEVLDENMNILFDVMLNEDNEVELLFYQNCVGKALKYKLFDTIIKEIKKIGQK